MFIVISWQYNLLCKSHELSFKSQLHIYLYIKICNGKSEFYLQLPVKHQEKRKQLKNLHQPHFHLPFT